MKTLSTYFEDMVLSPEPNAFCMLKPGFNQYKDEFERLLKLNGWKIIKHCTKQFTRPEIEDFYIMHKDQGFYHKLCDYMITEACECYLCYKHCKDPYKEMGDFKKKIRDEWGEDEMRNGMHSSDNKENMLKESNIAFNTVNEKLKVSSTNYSTPTYREYYDLLEKYCSISGKDLLDLFRLYNFKNDLLPKFKFEPARNDVIGLITPRTTKDKEIVLNIYDLKTSLSYFHVINVSEVANKLVDFMDDEFVEVTVEYMKGYIEQATINKQLISKHHDNA